MRSIISILIVCGIFLGLGGLAWYRMSLRPVSNKEVFHSLIIEKGSSAQKVAKKLKNENLIRNMLSFQIYVKLNKLDDELNAGQFRVSENWSVPKIVEYLGEGGFEGVWITLIEGWRREQMAMEFNKQLKNFDVGEFLELTKSKEGYLFPDTYLIPVTANPNSVVNLLLKTFKKKTQPLRDSSLSDVRFNQSIVLASILDREAAKDIDYPIVAGILWKRLENDWPLQADATLQYAKANLICKQSKINCERFDFDWWPDPLARDKEIDSPFNTYKYIGLPPAPIANPSLTAIKAALKPEVSKYWFYITDMKGNMHYSVTLEEHNRNVDRYLR